MSSEHQAPQPEQMRRACSQARQFWHLQFPDVPVRLHVESVPQFVPGLNRSGESYRVGAIQLVDDDVFLSVFLDVANSRIQVEQPLLEVALRDGGDANAAG